MTIVRTPATGEPHAIVIGAGIAGLAAALVLSRRGMRVSLLETDREASAASPAAAFEVWQRPGAPQVRHSHVFLGRLRNLLRDHYPDVLGALLAAGARELRPTDYPPAALRGLPAEPGDEDLVILGCRRTTFEWVLRQQVTQAPGVQLLSGTRVRGLLAARTQPPIVSGVVCESAAGTRRLRAHLVVDASGRRSAAPQWLAEIGARPPDEKQEASGIVYYTRFYRLRGGAAEPPPSEHPGAADFDWIKFAVFPADNRTFSVTLAVPLAVPALKVLAQPAAFDAMLRQLPGAARWADPSIAEPVDDGRRPVQAMGGLINRVRRFVDARGPLASRFFVLGDAAYCTNPLYGRGCAQGFLHAHLLGDALELHGDDWAAVAVALDARARAELEPFYWASVIADRDAVRRAEGRAPRRWSDKARDRFFQLGVLPASRGDPVVYRAMMRMMNMLETPAQAFGHAEVIARSLWVLARGAAFRQRVAPPAPPDRHAAIAACRAVAPPGSWKRAR